MILTAFPMIRLFLFAVIIGCALPARAASDPTAPVHDPALQIPKSVQPLFDTWMRDTFVTLAADGFYYLTGTTAAPGKEHCWDWNDGLHLWRSRDLKQWDHLGLIWSLDRDATWQGKPVLVEPGQISPSRDVMDEKRRAVWAPEIHYIKSKRAWLIVACMNGGRGSFILRSTSGKPEGPYDNIAGNATGPIFKNIDGSLFEDDDGTVYFVGHNHFIARMKDDLSGLAEPVRQLQETPYEPEPYAEGVCIVKHDRKYHLVQTYWSFKKPDGKYSYLGPQYNHPSRHSYDVIVATADNVDGPYGPRYTAIVEGGHNNFFQDRDGRWWATMFGNPRGASAQTAAFLCRPAIVPLKYEDGRFRPDPTR
jgi:beta-xylosidase